MSYLNTDLLDLMEGSAFDRLREIPDESVDLWLTSPPYANQRDQHYEGVPHQNYVDWFRPIAQEVRRTLKPTGSFLLNVKAHCENGRRLRYDQHTVDMCVTEGLVYTDEYVWYKSKRPGRVTRRLADAWEPVYHLTKTTNSFINHPAIAVKSEWTMVNQTAFISNNPRTGNKGGYTDIAEHGDGITDPDNIFRFSTDIDWNDLWRQFVVEKTGNSNVPDAYLNFPVSHLTLDAKYKHPAKFPLEFAYFLVRAFCPPGGRVGDMFMGSGMTANAALWHGCSCVGIELEPRFIEMIKQRLREFVPPELRKGWIGGKTKMVQEEIDFPPSIEVDAQGQRTLNTPNANPQKLIANPFSGGKISEMSSFPQNE